MTPAQYLAVARDLVILTAIGLLLWWVYRGGENAVKAGDLKALQADIQRQATIAEGWHKEATDATDKLSQDLAAIHAAPVVVHDWTPAGLRDESCPKQPVLPSAPAPAGSRDSEPGGAQPGRGDAAAADRRDFAVAQFKRKWEGVLAECRATLDQWPH